MFAPVPQTPDFPTSEAATARRWATHRVFARMTEGREGAAEFVFYEGPPTANGRPGLHHVWARIYKDLFCRFQTMRGRRVDRRAGWDTHGLPVEVEVEKRLGFSGKDEIERYGIDRFVEACRASVREYVDEWERITDRIGYATDLDSAYWTLDSSYVQSVWWHLKRLFDTNLLYEDVKVVPYCTRCGTALSSHELGQPDVYRDLEDLSVTVRLPIIGDAPGGAQSLTAWTTTPWTLPSNVGIAVHPDLTYVVVDGMVIAASRADDVLGEGARARATAELTGTDLVGVRYRRPFDFVEVAENTDAWRVVAAEYVTAEEGTGLVHLAPAFGADDWTVGRREGLLTLNPVGPDGRFVGAGPIDGTHVRDPDLNRRLVEILEAHDLVVRADTHVHSYPHCWRCQTPLIYWGTPSWYVATQSQKAALVAANETVSWQPQHIKHGRFGEWLENNVDWALSRDRYWGTPLPIWRCENRHVTCVGSLAELSDLAGRDVTGVDPHRPAIDEITFSCAACGEPMHRVEAVIDAWFDSGSMPAAQWGYPWADGSSERLRIPADFVCEAIDQTRGWFYSLLAVNVLVFGATPYRHVLSLGHIVDADGKKMSKSTGNVIDPWSILDTRGADPLRWWMYHQGSPWSSTRTSLEAIDASTADVVMTLWNTWSFFTTYASLNAFDPADDRVRPPEERAPFDRWIRSRLVATVGEVTEALERYAPVRATDAIATFVDDLSNWYVRCNRRRFWRTDPDLDVADSLDAQAALHEALVTVALVLAPFCPFLAEQMWTQLTDADEEASVHLASWPTFDDAGRDLVLEEEMELSRRLVSIGRAARSESGVKVRQPLRRAVVVLPPDAPGFLADVVAEELNVDVVSTAHEIGEIVEYEVVPNFRVLGPKLGEAVKAVRPALADADSAVIAAAVERGEPFALVVDGSVHELDPGDVEVRVRGRAGYALSREGAAAVALDLDVTDELRTRGLVRDVVRQIQQLRRDSGFEMADRIEVNLAGVDDLAASADGIGREVLAVAVRFGPLEGGTRLELDDDRMAWVAIRKVTQ